MGSIPHEDQQTALLIQALEQQRTMQMVQLMEQQRVANLASRLTPQQLQLLRGLSNPIPNQSSSGMPPPAMDSLGPPSFASPAASLGSALMQLPSSQGGWTNLFNSGIVPAGLTAASQPTAASSNEAARLPDASHQRTPPPQGLPSLVRLGLEQQQQAASTSFPSTSFAIDQLAPAPLVSHLGPSLPLGDSGDRADIGAGGQALMKSTFKDETTPFSLSSRQEQKDYRLARDDSNVQSDWDEEQDDEDDDIESITRFHP